SVMKLSSLFVPLLKKADEPSIINISSIAARSGGAPTAIIYAAAKSAIDSLTRGMAKGLAPKIRVNAVAPGVIETNFHERFTSTEQMEIFSQATPLKKNGNGIHVAMAVKMLVGNNFITGETIDVNGGLFMR
ncbi:MAG: SDR family oxidoreductase, partial [Melioribacteraceae bacterium]